MDKWERYLDDMQDLYERGVAPGKEDLPTLDFRNAAGLGLLMASAPPPSWPMLTPGLGMVGRQRPVDDPTVRWRRNAEAIIVQAAARILACV